MTGGGEERAVFLALKRDAQEALPKIAERNAHVVDSAVAKASQNLAAHADNEARTAADFRAKMPAANPLPSPRTAATSKIAQALSGSTPRPSTDLAAPRFGNAALRDSPNFDDQIGRELRAHGLDRAEHDRLRVSRTNDLTDEQIQQVVDVRNSIQIEDGQMITKVIHPDVAKAYVDNAERLPNGDPFFHDRFGGSIARGTDTADLTTPARLRDGLALDDGGAGWTPVREGAPEAYELRLRAPDDLKAETSYGAVDDQAAADRVARAAGLPTGRAWNDPFIGTGYTRGGVPEWQASGTEFPGRAEIWKMTSDGRETMVGFFERGRWTNLGI